MAGIPAHTRIIVVPDDGATYEYGISRPMVILFLLLVAVFCVVLSLMLVSFARRHDEREAIAVLERQLTDATAEVQTARALRAELDQQRDMQERLLQMLGVDAGTPAGDDSVAAWLGRRPGSAAEGLQRAAGVVMSPKPSLWPARGYFTREFNPGALARGIKPHPGIDIAGPSDEPVVAAADGVVDRVGTDEFLGNFVEIRHGLGYLTVYGHCSRVAVGQGDRVEAGQVVAYVGQTGEATAPHLHFEIWYQGEAVDPRTVIAGEPQRN